jgi:tetratricopeptide (TPR) repeat protein
MAAQVSTPTPRTIRVYCPSHKVGFSAAATATIECSSATHTLAHDFPSESFWEYCCDCQHYWPIDAAQGNKGSDECPVCERHLDRRSLCAECKVMSVESNDAAKRKAFSISSHGSVSPACPGCLRQTNRALLEHSCPDFGYAFVTTREVCPFCDERLERPPNFPCSVAAYLEKLPRSARAVRFQPEKSLLTEAKTGEYFLIPLARGLSLSIVIPRSTKFSSKQDYYNSYYELFNCENPVAGEVMIMTPAVVETVEGGWQLKETGFIEIKPNPVPEVLSDAITCSNCGEPGLTEHTFCKRCGWPLDDNVADLGITDPVDAPVGSTTSAYPSQDITASPPAATGLPSKVIFPVAGGVVLLGIILLVITINSATGSSIEKRLDKAIAAGQIFAPANENAHDLYLQLKNSGASEERLRPYREKLLPLLTEHKFQLIRNFMVPGSDDPPAEEWQSAYQSLQFAVELIPGDSSLLARTLYCEGRLAFLAKDEDRAIQIWTRAGDADKTWPLAVNGIGLIYTARKNYPGARGYYFEAVRRDANWAYPYNNIGTSFYLEKNTADAKGYYKKAVELAPQWARPHSWLGDIAMKEQDYNTAIQEFSIVLEPSTTGTKSMDLDKIRRQLEIARQKVSF